jgi:hypothetical protein
MAAMAAASALVMGQQPALHMVQGERTSSGYAGSVSIMHLRRTGVAAVALRPTFRQAARGSHSRRSFVAAAVGGEAGFENEDNTAIEIEGDGEDSGEIEISGVLEATEEESVLLEPPANSIDEGYVEALNDGTLEPTSNTSSDSSSEEQYEDDDVEDLKQQLIDTLYGTERGLRASSDTRAEVIELITQLEAKNPTEAPTEALTLLNGKWVLAYTSFSELFPLLAAGNLPLVKVGEITQIIDAQALTIENCVSFEGPVTATSFSASASFEIRSPKRIQVKFEEGSISAPMVSNSAEIPSSLDIMGQKIDLSAAKGLLKPLEDAAMAVARALSGQPPLKFSIQNDRAQSWLLTTYLDEDLRISRGDGGSVFVLLREGSTLLY